MLAPDVHGDFDHGGLIPGTPNEELIGADRVARQLLEGFSGASLAFDATVVNGEPGGVARRDGRILTVLSFDFDQTHVTAIRGIGNPQKLRHLGVHRDERALRRPVHRDGRGGRLRADRQAGVSG